MFADLWPAAAIAYVTGVFVARIHEIVTGEQGTTGAGMLSLLIVLAIPTVDHALGRALAAAAAAPPSAGPPSIVGLLVSYHPVLRQMIHIVVVVLLAYMIWEIARTAIDRRLADERDLPADSPSSRLRTLLPLLRVTLMITIGVMATLSVLAALGVDILPLLAGASVVGIAIGFGSQQLVRDVVSGAFFLMDDAFRLGKYIEIGAAKGRIEKFTDRSSCSL